MSSYASPITLKSAPSPGMNSPKLVLYPCPRKSSRREAICLSTSFSARYLYGLRSPEAWFRNNSWNRIFQNLAATDLPPVPNLHSLAERVYYHYLLPYFLLLQFDDFLFERIIILIINFQTKIHFPNIVIRLTKKGSISCLDFLPGMKLNSWRDLRTPFRAGLPLS